MKDESEPEECSNCSPLSQNWQETQHKAADCDKFSDVACVAVAAFSCIATLAVSGFSWTASVLHHRHGMSSSSTCDAWCPACWCTCSSRKHRTTQPQSFESFIWFYYYFTWLIVEGWCPSKWEPHSPPYPHILQTSPEPAGAGPAGVQLGHFLKHAHRDYVIFERPELQQKGRRGFWEGQGLCYKMSQVGS